MRTREQQTHRPELCRRQAQGQGHRCTARSRPGKDLMVQLSKPDSLAWARPEALLINASVVPWVSGLGRSEQLNVIIYEIRRWRPEPAVTGQRWPHSRHWPRCFKPCASPRTLLQDMGTPTSPPHREAQRGPVSCPRSHSECGYVGFHRGAGHGGASSPSCAI